MSVAVTGEETSTQQRQQRWDDWLALSQEAALDPEIPIVDPHHHLWDRGGHTYLPAQFAQDAAGHRLLASVYVECLSHYYDAGPVPVRPASWPAPTCPWAMQLTGCWTRTRRRLTAACAVCAT